MKLKLILATGLFFSAFMSCQKEDITPSSTSNVAASVDNSTTNSALDYYNCGNSTNTILRTVAGSTVTSGGSCGSSSWGSSCGSSCGSSSCGSSSCGSSSSWGSCSWGSSSSGSSCGGGSTSTTVDCGVVLVSNNHQFIQVKVSTTGNWILSKTRIYIGATAGIPKNANGTPKIANFSYITTHAWNTDKYTLKIPRSNLTGNISVVVQADVLRVNKTTAAILESRTSWGIGTNFISTDPSQRINYNIKNCVEV